MKDKVWVSIPVTSEVRDRYRKAAARNDMSTAAYLRMATRTYMERSGEWALPGPKRGQG